MKRRILVAAMLAALLAVGAFVIVIVLWPQPAPAAGETPVSVPGGTYTDITPQRLAEILAAPGQDFVLINTHIPYDGEIEATDDFIPYDQIAQTLDHLPADKSARIVLYCRSGNMSTTASKTLVQLGYTNVSNLAGGMKAWREAGFSIITDGG